MVVDAGGLTVLLGHAAHQQPLDLRQALAFAAALQIAQIVVHLPVGGLRVRLGPRGVGQRQMQIAHAEIAPSGQGKIAQAPGFVKDFLGRTHQPLPPVGFSGPSRFDPRDQIDLAVVLAFVLLFTDKGH